MKLTIVKTNYALGYSCDQCFFNDKICPLHDEKPICRLFGDDYDIYHFEQLQ